MFYRSYTSSLVLLCCTASLLFACGRIGYEVNDTLRLRADGGGELESPDRGPDASSGTSSLTGGTPAPLDGGVGMTGSVEVDASLESVGGDGTGGGDNAAEGDAGGEDSSGGAAGESASEGGSGGVGGDGSGDVGGGGSGGDSTGGVGGDSTGGVGGDSTGGVGGDGTGGDSSVGAGGGSADAGSGGTASGGAGGGGPTETCSDGVLNQDESDTDCGGICSPCDVDQACNGDADCIQPTCLAGICRDPGTCADGAINQDETDIDCGGTVCSPCVDGAVCSRDLDCESGSCVGQVCQGSGTCSDGVQNQDETGMDCGGGTCPVCEDGQACEVGTDCQSGVCVGQLCTTPSVSCSDTADCTCDTYNGHTYWFCRSEMRGDESPAQCATIGMTMVRVDDAAENDWLLQQATAHGLHDVANIFLIGATKLTTDPEWVWPDGEAFWTGTTSGSPLNGLYNNWRLSSPRSAFDCVALVEDTFWLDLSCGSANPFVCESP